MEIIRRAVVAVGSVLMGPGNWSMSVKLEKAIPASTGRHVNVQSPSDESIMDRPTQPFLIRNPISILKGKA